MRLCDIPTPALVIDEGILMQNEAAMAALTAGRISLRPHYKSHKCASLARRQIEKGAKGMTCAKLSEAEDLADEGIEDILIANQIFGEERLLRAALLARRCRLTVCVDSEAGVLALSRAAEAVGSHIHAYVEYDIGMERCGVHSHEAVVRLALLLRDSKGVSFDGVQAYAGHISHEVSAEKRAAFVEANGRDLKDLLAKLEAAGVPARELSGGSTGTAKEKAAEGLYTELQAGSYLMMDATYRLLQTPFQNSLFILATVITAREGHAVLDVGVKGLGIDQGMPLPVGFTAEQIAAHEEHLLLTRPSVPLARGERVRLIPGHCCSTVNLYDKIYLVKGDKVTGRLFVTARGKSQ